jgi:hypothetical protein
MTNKSKTEEKEGTTIDATTIDATMIAMEMTAVEMTEEAGEMTEKIAISVNLTSTASISMASSPLKVSLKFNRKDSDFCAQQTTII